jgi:hypothetical protein
MTCACQRYPDAVCINVTDDLLCPECTEARCVVVEFLEGSEAHEEHVEIDNLIVAEPGETYRYPS